MANFNFDPHKTYGVLAVARQLDQSIRTIYRALENPNSPLVKTVQPFRIDEQSPWQFRGDKLNTFVGAESYVAPQKITDTGSPKVRLGGAQPY